MPKRGAGLTAQADALVPAQPLQERFAARLAQLWPEHQRDDTARLAVALSGGPDSTGLLLLAAACLPGRVIAATVDHGLRAESAAEAQEAAALCERLGVPHRILPVEVDDGNVQAEARKARYAALAGWLSEAGAGALATGHHADDQAETLVLRLNRASGVAGLAGVRARGFIPQTDIPLIRPLLDWRRAEIVAMVEAAGVATADDPSNRDDRFDRARLRRELAAADWLDPAAIAASATHLADADEALDWAAAREWGERVHMVPGGLAYRPLAPRAIRLRVLARMVGEVNGSEARGSAVAKVHDALASGGPASIGDCVARSHAGVWSVTKAPRRRTG